ncbi:MAG: 2OG-Fe(II) oxygenase [Acidimicrobiia bacterium]
MAARVAAWDWAAIAAELDELGGARTPVALDPRTCTELADAFDDDGRYRSTVDLARHRFGAGRYRYFANPLPEPVQALREACWPFLLPIARSWAERLRRPAPWPDTLEAWLGRCHEAGQRRPTPLVLRYGPGDWNALHRDLYGELVFPLQVVVGLDRPGVDFDGGELVLVEQRPRAQSRSTVFSPPQGSAVIITTADRPLRTARGWSAAPVRHGVSVVRRGRRRTLGIIFHDAT